MCGTALAQSLDQTDSSDSANTAAEQGVACPDDRHSVCTDIVRTAKTFAESPGFLGKNIELRIGCDDLARSVAREGVMQHFIDESRLGILANGDRADVDSLHWHPFVCGRRAADYPDGVFFAAIYKWLRHHCFHLCPHGPSRINSGVCA
jgi:hypothetical protein